ncbi:hypothetical protein SSX86_028128 [Deinandra increscens subsp. villosa]|uniref:Fungal lipase-type domain-containing protein n=1 Tax=Deinandra increscens subsp. villosa TaxID=3103831 RepID=A0AAP0C8T3_9ASTR
MGTRAMRLGIKQFTPMAKPLPEPLCRWRCAMPTKTAQRTSGYTRVPSKTERLDCDSRQGGHETSSLSRLDKRWKEYHGSEDWEGLLDPLDDGLRVEIMRYGSFVEAAYQCFDSDLSSPTYATCRYARNSMLEQVGFSGSGYRVTKNLYATSSIPMPHWTGQIGVRSSWIGYVAVCEDENEISRLGRRDIVISLRGTATCSEWLENLRVTLTSCPFASANDTQEQNDNSKVETGVLNLYTSSTSSCPSLQQSLRHEILRIVQKYNNEPLSVTITGHSLGASLAILAAYDLKTAIKHDLHLSVISFGGPRVGNRSFRQNLERQGTKILRIVNSDDLVTKVPGFFVEDHNDVALEKKGRMTNLPHWMQKHVKDNQWVYANIGHELRLSSRASLKLNNGASPLGTRSFSSDALVEINPDEFRLFPLTTGLRLPPIGDMGVSKGQLLERLQATSCIESTLFSIDRVISEHSSSAKKKRLGEVTVAEDTVMEVSKENDEQSNKPTEAMDTEMDHAVVKQEEITESTVAEVKESLAPSATSGGLLPCKDENGNQ